MESLEELVNYVRIRECSRRILLHQLHGRILDMPPKCSLEATCFEGITLLFLRWSTHQ